MMNINGKMYRNVKEQYEYINKCKKLLDLIYDYYEEEDFDKIRCLLSIQGFDTLEELEDIANKEIIYVKSKENR